MKVRAKILSNSDYGWFDFWGAIDSWVNRKGIEIAREPDLAEYESDEEREQALRIIKGIWERLAENPRTAYMMKKEGLDSLEKETLNDIIEMDEPRIERQHLLNKLQEKHPTHDRDTLRRRVDSIVEKGQLDRVKDGISTFYSLKARQRREILV